MMQLLQLTKTSTIVDRLKSLRAQMKPNIGSHEQSSAVYRVFNLQTRVEFHIIGTIHTADYNHLKWSFDEILNNSKILFEENDSQEILEKLKSEELEGIKQNIHLLQTIISMTQNEKELEQFEGMLTHRINGYKLVKDKTPLDFGIAKKFSNKQKYSLDPSEEVLNTFPKDVINHEERNSIKTIIGVDVYEKLKSSITEMMVECYNFHDFDSFNILLKMLLELDCVDKQNMLARNDYWLKNSNFLSNTESNPVLVSVGYAHLEDLFRKWKIQGFEIESVKPVMKVEYPDDYIFEQKFETFLSVFDIHLN